MTLEQTSHYLLDYQFSLFLLNFQSVVMFATGLTQLHLALERDHPKVWGVPAFQFHVRLQRIKLKLPSAFTTLRNKSKETKVSLGLERGRQLAAHLNQA
jgi:hypothetical protein